MNRQEFLTGLAQLLKDIPEAERQEALDYYNNYFDDAGPENEAMVIQELGGTPDKAAASIQAELRSGKTGKQNYGEYTEQGYRDTRIPKTDQMPQPVPQPEKKNHRIPKIVWIILILSVTSGIWLGILGGLISGIFGLLGGLLSLLVGLAAVVFSMIVGGIALIVSGLVKCVANPALGLLVAGLGMLLLSLGILLLALFLWLAKKLLPKLDRWLRGHLWKLLDWCKTKWEIFKRKE